ncbi:unnamed protein product [Meganyctiphanes norvegica]|uniref:Uncharacterized protein n=1 Tax=Meganyctiphanes norvegica TaxID=48144 RepID=A0AAV2PWF9_MEGNR
MKILVSVCLVILAVVFESEALQCYVCYLEEQGCPDPNSSNAGIIEDNDDFKTCFKMDVTTEGETFVARGGVYAKFDLPEVCNDANVGEIKDMIVAMNLLNSALVTRLDTLLARNDITRLTPVKTCVCETYLCNDNKIDQTATTPQTSTETPQTPTETPQTPTETPQTPTETPHTSTTENGASTNAFITSMLIAGVSIFHKLLW